MSEPFRNSAANIVAVLSIAALTAFAFNSQTCLAAAKEIVMHFPKAHAVGRATFFQDQNAHKATWVRPAQADLTIPTNGRLGLTLNYSGAHDTAFLRRLEAPYIVSLDAAKLDLTDAQASDIATLTGLHDLDLQDTDITDKGCLLLGGLKELSKFNIARTMITGKGLAVVGQFKKLFSLDAGYNQLDDGALAHLAGLDQLQEIKLSSCNIGDQGLKHISKLSRLTSLKLDHNKRITDAGVASLSGLHLTFLDLTGGSLTSACITYLKHMTTLTSLYIDTRIFQKSQLDALAKALPHCLIKASVRDANLSEDLFGPLHSPIAPQHTTGGAQLEKPDSTSF